LEEIAMRKPLDRIMLHSRIDASAAQPMLKPSSKFRYDPPKCSEFAWADSFDFDPDLQEPDMDVTGAGPVGGSGPIRPTQLNPAHHVEGTSSSGIEAPQDEVHISSAARSLGQIDAGAQIHEARLAEIRAAIADGTYDTPEKLDAAVERLMDSLRGEI
jgi:negative regulator of flagellin synthesis FlgM